MYNLPNVTTLFGPVSCTLDGTELIHSGLKVDDRRPYLQALLDRVKPKVVA